MWVEEKKAAKVNRKPSLCPPALYSTVSRAERCLRAPQAGHLADTSARAAGSSHGETDGRRCLTRGPTKARSFCASCQKGASQPKSPPALTATRIRQRLSWFQDSSGWVAPRHSPMPGVCLCVRIQPCFWKGLHRECPCGTRGTVRWARKPQLSRVTLQLTSVVVFLVVCLFFRSDHWLAVTYIKDIISKALFWGYWELGVELNTSL